MLPSHERAAGGFPQVRPNPRQGFSPDIFSEARHHLMMGNSRAHWLRSSWASLLHLKQWVIPTAPSDPQLYSWCSPKALRCLLNFCWLPQHSQLGWTPTLSMGVGWRCPAWPLFCCVWCLLYPFAPPHTVFQMFSWPTASSAHFSCQKSSHDPASQPLWPTQHWHLHPINHEINLFVNNP